MVLNYYRNGDSVLATIAAMNLPTITQEEYDAKISAIEKSISSTPAPEPTTEERIAVLEEQLAAAKILLGLEE